MLRLVAFEPGRDVIVAQPGGVEPILKTRSRAIVSVQPAIPEALERWNLVESSSLARLEGEIRIGADRDGKDVGGKGVIFGRAVALCQRQLVVGVERSE